MRIFFLQSHLTEAGRSQVSYQAGRFYDVADDLAEELLASAIAATEMPAVAPPVDPKDAVMHPATPKAPQPAVEEPVGIMHPPTAKSLTIKVTEEHEGAGGALTLPVAEEAPAGEAPAATKPEAAPIAELTLDASENQEAPASEEIPPREQDPG